MYQDFYGLIENPFSLSPDPHYLYLTPCHREALRQLCANVGKRQGLITLIGEVGMGKTLLINCFLNLLAEKSFPACYIFNSIMTTTDLIEYISADFHLDASINSKRHFYLQLYKLLLELSQCEKTAILIIDEAQNLSFDMLAELCLLANFGTRKERLLQIVLAGQPELSLKLNHPAMRQIKRQFAQHCLLKPFSYKETQEYIYTRLVIGGLQGRSPFDTQVTVKIHELSGGIPRVINSICDNALMVGYAYKKLLLDQSIICEVVVDL